MKHPVLWVVVPAALALNLWLGDRVPAGTICLLFRPPAAASTATAGDTGPGLSRLCPPRSGSSILP